MLEHLGEAAAARIVMGALEKACLDGPRTVDLGGTATTDEVAAAVAGEVARVG